MVKILKYDNPYHKIKLKIRQIQVLGKSTGQINNTGYEMFTKFFSAIGFILGLMDFSDIAYCVVRQIVVVNKTLSVLISLYNLFSLGLFL